VSIITIGWVEFSPVGSSGKRQRYARTCSLVYLLSNRRFPPTPFFVNGKVSLSLGRLGDERSQAKKPYLVWFFS
jgi:hypothetical protein